jgi:hypothetical protein
MNDSSLPVTRLVVRFILFVFICALALYVTQLFEQTADPSISRQLALDTLNGGEQELATQRAYQTTRANGWITWVVWASVAGWGFASFYGPVRAMLPRKRKISATGK